MAQFARPDGDNSIGSWTDQSLGTTTIYTTIDEVSASDSDYVRSEDNPGTSVCNFTLSDVDDPLDSSNHVVRYRYRKQESGSDNQIDLTVRLREGVTSRASNSHTNISTSWVDGSFTLSGSEADSITDYADLVIEFEANKASGADTAHAEVSWAEFEVPSVSLLRSTQSFADVILADVDPSFRSTQMFMSTLTDNDPAIRSTQKFMSALTDNDPSLRSSQVFAFPVTFPQLTTYKPESDTSTGSWTSDGVNFYDQIDADDASAIYSSLNPTLGDSYEAVVETLTWPDDDYPVIVYMRIEKVDSGGTQQSDGNELDVVVDLINDSAVIWTWTLDNIHADQGLVTLWADRSTLVNPKPATPTQFSLKITTTSDGVGADRKSKVTYAVVRSYMTPPPSTPVVRARLRPLRWWWYGFDSAGVPSTGGRNPLDPPVFNSLTFGEYPGMYLGEHEIDDTLTFSVTTHDPSNGAATDADAVPSYRVYEDETSTAILTGNMAKLDDANTTGYYSEQLTLSAANGFEVGKSYQIYIEAAVGGTTGAKTMTFHMKAAVLTAADIADQVWDEAQADHTSAGSFGEIATEIASILVDTAEIGAAGAGLSAIPWNASWDAEVQSEVNDALVDIGLDHLVFTSVTGTDIADNSIIARLASKSATADWDSFNNTTDSLEAIADNALTAAQVNAEVLDVMCTDTFAEPGSVPAATATLCDMLHWVYTLSRNKITQTSAVQTLRNDADSGSISTASVSDDGTTFTRDEWA